MAVITQELVKQLFDYKDGLLYWKVKSAIRIKIGDSAGYLRTQDNRYMTWFNGKLYYAHKLIFLWHHGYIPAIVDHIDRDSTNNKIENLRAATARQNNCNRQAKKNGSSKYLGVHSKRKTKWQSSIRVNRKPIHIGTYETQESAALAYNREAVRYHGEFANLNIITYGR